ncbi:MAG TPA: hypothetical protein EYP43_03665, partial [Thermoplasmata archaeon]|nr:hypothetical protein [Thermoplasmata archaeon]
KGFSYVIAIIMVYYLVQLLVNAFKHEDSTGLAVIILTVLTVPLILALPAYASMNMLWSQWGLRPVIYIYIGALALTAAFVPTRDVPWIILLPSLLIAGSIGYTVVHHVNPDLAETMISGAGYFVKTKRYSTIAEAQAPILSRLIVSYGPVTFFFALVGILFATIRFTRHWKTDELFIVIWTFVSIFMAISAVRFMFNAAPAFAILQGWVTLIILRKTDFRAIRKALYGFSGQFWYGLKKGLKVRHGVVAAFMVFMVILPNAWYAFDAALPYEKKREIDNQIYSSMPEWLRPEKYKKDSTLWYTGAFGQGFPSDYWYSYFKWLSRQDTEYDPEDRPAFLSWWDYGMWCVQIGKHPTVADNFMSGHELAGNFIAAPNETWAMGLLVTRILEFEIRDRPNGPAADLVREYLGEEDAATFIDAILHPKDYIDTVKEHPEIYGRKEGLRHGNAKYSVCAYIVSKLPQEAIADMLLDAERLTGNWIRYFAVDSRMFPFSYYNTGIFYAPITLSDHYVSDFLKTMVKVGDRLVTLEEFQDMRELDPELEPDDLVLSYTPRFFNSMFYRAYIGYSPQDIGQDASLGIPGLSGQMASQPPMQGWMMKHFKLAYKTAYWNPYEGDEIREHKDAWKAISFDEAVDLSSNESVNGTVDIQTGLVQGVMVLKYYPGAIVSGRVITPGGMPIPGVRVTVFDHYGIPHDTNTTADDGSYSLIAPSGVNVSVIASQGGQFNPLYQTYSTIIARVNITITDDQAERRELDRNDDGVPDYLIDLDLVANSTWINGTAFWDSDHDGDLGDDEMPLVDAELELNGTNVIRVTTDANGTFGTSDAIETTYSVYLLRDGERFPLDIEITSDGKEPVEKNIPVKGFRLTGEVEDAQGNGVRGVEIRLEDTETGEVMVESTRKGGKYTFEDVLPGHDGGAELVLTIDETGKVPIERHIQADMGQETRLDLRLLNASHIRGGVSLDTDGDGDADRPATGVLVVAAGEHDSYQAPSADDGSFSLTLPEGRYRLTARLLGDDGTYKGEIRSDAPADDVALVLTRVHRVGGTLFIDHNEDGEFDEGIDTPAERADIGIIGPANWSGQANHMGVFSALLPPGEYYISARFESEGGNATYLNSTWFVVDRDMMLDLLMEESRHLTGTVYWDMNDDGLPQPGEYLDGLQLVFTGEHEFGTTSSTAAELWGFGYDGNIYYHTFRASSGTNGTFEIDLISDNYTVHAPNFSPVPLEDWDDPLINLTPERTRVTGVVWADGNHNGIREEGEIAGPGLPVTIESLGPQHEIHDLVTDADGAVHVDLLPGRYEVRVNATDDSDSLFQVLTTIDVPFGQAGYSADLPGGRLVHFEPSFEIDGTPLDPADFGPTDLVRVVPHGLPENRSIPTESGVRTWQDGGYLFPGDYDVYVRYRDTAAL